MKTESSKATMAILAIGGLLVAGLVVWALTRTVQPAPDTATEVIPTASAPVGIEPAAGAPNPAMPAPDTTAGMTAAPGAPPAQTSTYTPNPPTPDENATVPRIGLADLKARIDAKEVVVVDVRDKTSYVTAHIPGALHMPMATVESQVDSLPKNRQIVTYCTWPNEESSARAALIMRKYGLTNVSALDGGFDAWRGSGSPTQQGEPPAVQ